MLAKVSGLANYVTGFQATPLMRYYGDSVSKPATQRTPNTEEDGGGVAQRRKFNRREDKEFRTVGRLLKSGFTVLFLKAQSLARNGRCCASFRVTWAYTDRHRGVGTAGASGRSVWRHGFMSRIESATWCRGCSRWHNAKVARDACYGKGAAVFPALSPHLGSSVPHPKNWL